MARYQLNTEHKYRTEVKLVSLIKDKQEFLKFQRLLNFLVSQNKARKSEVKTRTLNNLPGLY